MTFQQGALREFGILAPILIDDQTLLATLVLPSGEQIHMVPIKLDVCELINQVADLTEDQPDEKEPTGL